MDRRRLASLLSARPRPRHEPWTSALTNLHQLSFPAVSSLLLSRVLHLLHLRNSGRAILQSDREVSQKRVHAALTYVMKTFILNNPADAVGSGLEIGVDVKR